MEIILDSYSLSIAKKKRRWVYPTPLRLVVFAPSGCAHKLLALPLVERPGQWEGTEPGEHRESEHDQSGPRPPLARRRPGRSVERETENGQSGGRPVPAGDDGEEEHEQERDDWRKGLDDGLPETVDVDHDCDTSEDEANPLAHCSQSMP